MTKDELIYTLIEIYINKADQNGLWLSDDIFDVFFTKIMTDTGTIAEEIPLFPMRHLKIATANDIRGKDEPLYTKGHVYFLKKDRPEYVNQDKDYYNKTYIGKVKLDD